MGRTELTDRSLRLAIMLAMVVIILAGVKAAADVVVPFLLAVFLAMVLNPLVTQLERWRIPRALGVTLLVVAVVVILMLFIGILGASLNEFARSLPQYRGMMMEKLGELQRYADRFNITISTEAMLQYVDPSAAMNMVTRLLSRFSGDRKSVV